MPQIPENLAGALALNICRTRDGWQASLERSKGSFSTGHGASLDDAIADALRITPCPVPICPVPLPSGAQ